MRKRVEKKLKKNIVPRWICQLSKKKRVALILNFVIYYTRKILILQKCVIRRNNLYRTNRNVIVKSEIE